MRNSGQARRAGQQKTYCLRQSPGPSRRAVLVHICVPVLLVVYIDSRGPQVNGKAYYVGIGIPLQRVVKAGAGHYRGDSRLRIRPILPIHKGGVPSGGVIPACTRCYVRHRRLPGGGKGGLGKQVEVAQRFICRGRFAGEAVQICGGGRVNVPTAVLLDLPIVGSGRPIPRNGVARIRCGARQGVRCVCSSGEEGAARGGGRGRQRRVRAAWTHHMGSS
jgi:hypothetical protein